jgi:outer membrane protein OmpA-like peptidoglycan-associated protein
MTMAMEVEFDAREAEILPQYHDGLAEVVRFMKANPSVSATVEGHAAKRAGMVSVSQEQAMNISQRRAQAVVNYLVSAGISRSRLTTSVFGSTRRISYGTTLEGQQENRRVNIIFDYSK